MFALISRPIGSAIERQKRELSRSSTYANSAVTAINTVKAFNGEDQEVWQYFLTTKAITRYYLIQARANALQSGVIKFFAVGLFVTGFWYGLYLATHGLTVGHVITTIVSCVYAMQAVEIILPQFLVLAKGISAGETLKSVMAETQEGRSTHDEDGDLTPHGCPGDIEINGVRKAESSTANTDILIDLICISLESKSECTSKCDFLLSRWRDNVYYRQERVRKEYNWQSPHEILRGPIWRNSRRWSPNPNLEN